MQMTTLDWGLMKQKQMIYIDKNRGLSKDILKFQIKYLEVINMNNTRAMDIKSMN